jgi:hypothetical protein
MVRALMRHNDGQTVQEANEEFLSYIESLDGRTCEARAFKHAVHRRMSFVSY